MNVYLVCKLNKSGTETVANSIFFDEKSVIKYVGNKTDWGGMEVFEYKFETLMELFLELGDKLNKDVVRGMIRRGELNSAEV